MVKGKALLLSKLPKATAKRPLSKRGKWKRMVCRDQEGRRGSEEAVPGPSVFPSGEPGVSGAKRHSNETSVKAREA